MSEINKLVEIMAEMLHEQKEAGKETKLMREELQEVNKRLEKLEIQMAKNTSAVGELRLSVMRLADEILVVHDHERRITELEKKVA